MKPAEKDEVMERFSEGKIDILVSTTVSPLFNLNLKLVMHHRSTT